MENSIIERLRSTKTFLSPEQLVEMLGGDYKVGSLAARRTRRQAPAFIKVGGLVRYDPAVVADWLESRTFTPPAPAPVQIPTWLQATRNKSQISGGQS